MARLEKGFDSYEGCCTSLAGDMKCYITSLPLLRPLSPGSAAGILFAFEFTNGFK
jgi:hypothetical protein